MHRKVAAALVAALALGVASCGGSESLTRAELVNRIEAACRQAGQRTQQEQRAARGDETSFFTALVAGQREMVERVEGLEAPDELADEVDTIKTGLADRTEMIASVAEASRAEQQRAMAEIGGRVEDITRRVEAAFRSLGIRGCG